MPEDNRKRVDRGFVELAAFFALLLSMAALLAVVFKLNDNAAERTASAQTTMPMRGMPNGMGGGYSASASEANAETLKLVVKSDEEHAKKGPEGVWHDAFLPADFSVTAGAVVSVTVYNYDDMPHTFTSPGLGVNAEVPGGSEGSPGKATFVFRAPSRAGSYEWFCTLPCDPWAMAHFGFMRGHVTVT